MGFATLRVSPPHLWLSRLNTHNIFLGIFLATSLFSWVTHTSSNKPNSSSKHIFLHSLPRIICLPCKRPWFDSWVGKICWRRDRLPSPVFLGFPGGSAGKESARNVGKLGSIPGLGRSPGEGKRLPAPVFWPGEFHGQRSLVSYSPWGGQELDMTNTQESWKILASSLCQPDTLYLLFLWA